MMRRWPIALLLFLAGLLLTVHAGAHVGALDAYGCHSDKALFGTSTKRECHTGLLAGQVFASTTAEYKAFIAAQATVLNTQAAQLTTQQTTISSLTTQLAACVANCPATPPPPPPPPPSTFVIGSRVVALASGVRVLSGPGFANPILQTRPGGDLGVLTAGPQTVDGYTWWQVDYDTGSDGWSTQPNLGLSTAPLPPPQPVTGSLTLTWQANTESDLAGYKAYCGLTSHVYTLSVSLGKVLTTTFGNLPVAKTYYCAVTAFDTTNHESGFSTEVSKLIP